ncbi:histidine kinase [Pseudomonas flexibilis]|uniref:histidine kinase n=1 Tax=Pseudomonas flexibilis TaxID=706570 RepID=A0A1N6NFC9_9PSED|nr:HAMP domain-containing sensor histidine kinase [Pseudomonas flexibilis]KHL70977.1 histidine kinase [Pseudomonas flexibilis]SIP90805.1 Signal transduction histidine kinase [Pseudomonas flexibilis]
MAINFKARVLLELGAELISSDAVAIYELVKNALDAGSKRVEIDINIALQYSAYSQLEESLSYLINNEENDSGFDVGKFNTLVESCIENDACEEVKSRFICAYGVPSSAVEALHNLRAAFCEGGTIVIRDQGAGMSLKALNSCYLTVGTPGRLLEKNALIQQVDQADLKGGQKQPPKIPLGEKGIGRLSAMRLGHLINVKSKVSGEKSWNWLQLDWRPAFLDPNLDAAELDFEPYQQWCSEEEEGESGTSIFISDLQSDWSSEKVDGIINNDLAKLADPFKSVLANKFIALRFQGKPRKIPHLDQEPLSVADAICRARFDYDEKGNPQLLVNVNYKRYARERTDHISGDHLRATVREEATTKKKKLQLIDGEVVAKALRDLGPWEMEFHWFNRGKIMRDHNDLYNRSIKPFLKQWGGGFLVYRDGYRVYPYGERSDDWLDLDRNALAASAYKLNRAQMVGYLRISSIDNPKLYDQTNREGFRDSYDKEALIRLLRYVILCVCRPFLELVERESNPPVEEVVAAVEEKITGSKQKAIASLKEIKGRVPQEAKSLEVVMHHLEEVSEAWERAKVRITSFEEELDQFMHLAGVGLMIEFIAHELTRVTQDTLRSVSSGKVSLDVVEAQLKTLEKRVRILDELSIPGRQRKADHDIYSIAEMLVEFHSSKCQRHNIEVVLRKTAKSKLSRRVEKGQILQILDNLFSNSFYWLVNRYDQREPAKIVIEVDSSDQKVYFSDNGPGISEERVESIFDQFVTTKPPREGRGLGLYIARRLAEENDASLELVQPDEDGMYRKFVISFN